MKNIFTKNARFYNLLKFVKSICIALFSLIASAGFAQSGTIILNGSSTLPISSATKFPIWLPGGSGQSINVGANVTSISGILYNITPSTAGGNIMTVNSVVYITGSTPIAAGTALKVEGILFSTTSSSTSNTWNIGGNTPGASSILGTTDNSPVSIQSGTGALSIGTGATSGAINIGGTTQTGGINIGTGTGAQTINIGAASDLTAIGGNETVAGTLAVTGASTLNALAQVGTANINATGTAVTNIGTGSNTGAISIGNSSNSVALPAFTTAGVVHNAVTTGRLSSSLINLAAGGDVSGILPVANGGTGSSSQNFVDLSNTQTAAGAKTWTNTATFSGSPYSALFTGGNVGIGTTVPTEALSICGAISSSPAAGETFTSGGSLTTANFLVKRDIATFSTSNSSPGYIQIKTNIPWNTSTYIMYRIVVEGYNFGIEAGIFSEADGYSAAAQTALPAQGQNTNYNTGAAITQYSSSDNYVCLQLAAANFYYAGFTVSAWTLNPAGYAFSIKIQSIVQQTAHF
jgi:hypothetical protein